VSVLSLSIIFALGLVSEPSLALDDRQEADVGFHPQGSAELPGWDDGPETVVDSERDGLPESDPTDEADNLERAEYGPFFEKVAPSNVQFPGRRTREYAPLSVSHGRFCFVEDFDCRVALLVDADVAAGINVIGGERGIELPYTQFRVRWGVTLRPVAMRRDRWHRWGLGVVGSWSEGSSVVIPPDADNSAEGGLATEAYRVAVVNQLWLAQKRNAAHLDFTVGMVRGRTGLQSRWASGTTVEFGLGLGGWGQVFVGGDFFDDDARVLTGFRAHAVAAGPVIGLVLLGMLAGGAL